MLIVPEILHGISNPPLQIVSETLEHETTAYSISSLNWDTKRYKPEVTLRIGYNSNELFLKFSVKEKYIRALCTENNSKVSTDSCCEFFVSPDCNDCYYNIEVNCIGTLLMGYRKMGEQATRPDAEIMQSIRRHSTLGNQPFEIRGGNFEWELIVTIPLKAFFKHQLNSFKEKKITANFYKCGDQLPEPHYLSLFPILTEKPAFHRPDFFQPIQFA